MRIQQEKVWFEGAHGDRLSGRLSLPLGQPLGWVLFAHCFTCGKDIRAARRISEGLARRSLGVLRFDFTGIGESLGDFADTNFSSNVDDLVAAAEFLRHQGRAPVLLVGHSLGGAAVIVAAPRIPECRAVATLAAPADLSHLQRRLERAQVDLLGESTVRIGPGTFTVRRQMLDDLQQHRLRDHVAALGRPLMVLHAPEDQVVPAEAARQLFAAARHPKSFVSLDTADHLVSDPRDGDWVAGMLAAWLARYLPEAS